MTEQSLPPAGDREEDGAAEQGERQMRSPCVGQSARVNQTRRG